MVDHHLTHRKRLFSSPASGLQSVALHTGTGHNGYGQTETIWEDMNGGEIDFLFHLCYRVSRSTSH